MTRLTSALAAALLLAACGQNSSGTDADTSGGDTSTDVGVDGDTGGGLCEDPDQDGWGPGCAAGNLDCLPFDAASNPGADELCGDLIDNDCDGEADEGCPCANGRVEPCYTGPDGTEGVGICSAGNRQCVDGEWQACSGAVGPRDADETACDGFDDDCDGEVDEGLTNACGVCGALPVEVCGDGLDNDCNGVIDDSDAGCDCDGRTRQPCYTGPPSTLGIGRCRGGLADCDDGGAWGACAGELLPDTEVCDGLDNDCDGEVDEGLRNRCGICGAPEPLELCDGEDNDCDGAVDEGLLLVCGLCPGQAPDEECGNGLDDDCDGLVDEACPCVGPNTCYPGPPGTASVGACRVGSRECDVTGEFWTACSGFVLPTIEICDGQDNDCDGVIDVGPDGCTVCGSDVEVCDGIDNDCDGLVDNGVLNACGECLADVVPETVCDALDNDCDGLIDEGLTNACGTCGESCYLATWDDPSGWDDGTFDGVDPDATAEGLRLGAARVAYPDLWVANSADGTVSRIDTNTASVVGTYTVGLDPSRTAVHFDGNVFVANRAFNDGPTARQGSVTRILAHDCVGGECVAWTTDIGDPGDVPRGLAVDRDGYAWVGTYYGRELHRVHPDTGEVVGTWPVPVSVYGLAIDSEGIIWIATMSASGIGAFDSNTETYLGSWTAPECTSPYGIAVDGVGNVWTGSWQCNSLIRLDRTLFDEGTVDVRHFTHPNMTTTRGVAVDGDGMVYVTASGSDRLGKFNPATSMWEWTVATCAGPIGVGVASDGNVWVICQDAEEAVRYTPDGVELDTVRTGNGPYSYSDMTGFQLRNFTAPSGTWNVVFDCGRAQCGFDRIVYDAALPAGTSVQVRARTRPAEPVDAPWSAWTSYLDGSPAEIAGSVPNGRFCEVEVRLSTSDRDLTPIVTSVTLEWQRP